MINHNEDLGWQARNSKGDYGMILAQHVEKVVDNIGTLLLYFYNWKKYLLTVPSVLNVNIAKPETKDLDIKQCSMA